MQIAEAAPNKLFSEEERAWIRFLRFNEAVPCADCGKRRRLQWTMLCEFRCQDLTKLISVPSKKRHMPLTPVCTAHPIGPAHEEHKQP